MYTYLRLEQHMTPKSRAGIGGPKPKANRNEVRGPRRVSVPVNEEEEKLIELAVKSANERLSKMAEKQSLTVSKITEASWARQILLAAAKSELEK
jgi:hypothetical protein